MPRLVLTLFFSLLLLGCSTYDYPSQVEIGKPMLSFEGESLAGKKFVFPRDVNGQQTILLFGYVHKSQFDIDRWLIGLDMSDVNVAIYEVPAIKGFFPRLFSKNFDDSMREGIPKELWRDVVTVYQDGNAVQMYTGNQKPKNARLILLDKNGQVKHFYDRGFSVPALNALREKL